jgi:hypothetical protein
MDKKILIGGRASGKMLEMLKDLGPGVVTVAEPTIKILKTKKEIPTVIEFQGRRYILDDRNRN